MVEEAVLTLDRDCCRSDMMVGGGDRIVRDKNPLFCLFCPCRNSAKFPTATVKIALERKSGIGRPEEGRREIKSEKLASRVGWADNEQVYDEMSTSMNMFLLDKRRTRRGRRTQIKIKTKTKTKRRCCQAQGSSKLRFSVVSFSPFRGSTTAFDARRSPFAARGPPEK